MDIVQYVAKCLNFNQVKVELLKPEGRTRIIAVPTRKWEAINMDFVVGLPKNGRQHDCIWVIMHRMTNSATLSF